MVITDCHLAFTFKDGTSYKLTTSIPCNPEHSYSSIIAISDFLLKNFPEIVPPYPQNLNEKIKQQTTSIFSPLSQFWNNYLIESIYKEMACRLGNQFYIIVALDYWNGELIRKELFDVKHSKGLSEFPPQEQIKIIFNISPAKSSKKIGIYQTHPNQSEQCIPYLTMHSLILVQSVQYPQKLSSFCGVITGSSYCVLDQTESISLSLKNLMLAFNESKKLKIIGTCYGHQLIAHYFGSGISTKPTIGGLEAIDLNTQIVRKFPFLQGLKECEDLHMSEHHSDHVDIVPTGFQLLASSTSCSVEALVSDDGRIYTSQFHPEVMFQYVQVLEKELISSGTNGFGYKFDVKEGLPVKNSKDSAIFLESMQAFIDS